MTDMRHRISENGTVPTKEDIRLGYRLFLERQPTAEELERMYLRQRTHADLNRTFALSKEFRKKRAQKIAATFAGGLGTIVHVHIPKTAGTSMNEILEKNYSAECILSISTETANIAERMAPQDISKVKVVRGHIQYDLVDDLFNNITCIFLLRKPGPRIFSFYSFVKRHKAHPLHEQVAGENMTFGDFLDFASRTPGLRNEIDSGQMRRVSGMLAPNHIGQEKVILQRALLNALAPRTLFGFTERFEDFLATLHQKGIICAPDNLRANVSRDGQSVEEALGDLSTEQRGLYQSFISWDTAFYDICEAFLYGPKMEGRTTP